MKPKNQIKWHKLYKQWWVLLLASCLITAITFGLCHTPFLQDLEHQVTDTLFRMDPRPDAADSSIVLVAVDDGSLAYFSQQGVSWPWPRSFYAHVVDYFADVGAEAVLFDMQFYEADLNREESYGRETDARFAKSISQAKTCFWLLRVCRIRPALTSFFLNLSSHLHPLYRLITWMVSSLP